MSEKVNIFWFRRDLRLEDNVGFSKALQGKYPVIPIFIFDSNILDELPKDDARLSFIYKTLDKISNTFKEESSGIAMYHGAPQEVFKSILNSYDVQNVIFNRDYEPYATERDKGIEQFLQEKQIGFYSFKDHVIFEKDEVVKADGTPYLVYTPYMKKWKEKFRSEHKDFNQSLSNNFQNLYKSADLPYLSLQDIGFIKSNIEISDFDVSKGMIEDYENKRNFPALDATSHLGPHLRFGTISIRKAVSKAIAESNEVFWQELIWREFFIQILWHFPETTYKSFKKQYDSIIWRNDEKEFEKWKSGHTGFGLVDAGMRQLNKTGYMHNRVRMLVASFLCKHLLIDWRWGEAYFAEKLLDYEMASNIGNWQWAAGSGVDAAPYFRIFNPMTQLEKFDPKHIYTKKWIPEFETSNYPEMMVDHKEARERCLFEYKRALDSFK